MRTGTVITLGAMVGLALACSARPRATAASKPTVAAAPPARPPPSPAPATPAVVPAPAVDGNVLAFVDRRGAYTLRHYGQRFVQDAVSDDGTFAASGGAIDATAIVWDLRTGAAVARIQTPQTNLWAVALSHDTKLLATAGWDGTIRLWDVATGAQRWAAKTEANALAFSPDDQRVVASIRGTPRVVDVATGRVLWDGTPHGPGIAARGAIVAPDGRRTFEQIATKRSDQLQGDRRAEIPVAFELRVIDLDTGGVERTLPEVTGTLVAVSPSGDRLAALDDHQLTVIDATAGRLIAQVPAAGATAAMLLDGGHTAVTWSNTDVAVWDLVTKRQLWRDAFTGLAPVIAGGVALVGARADGCVAWRIADGMVLWHRPCSNAPAAAAHARRALVATGPSALEVVDAETGDSLLPPAPPGPRGAIATLAVSPDGRTVVGWSDDLSLWAWDDHAARQLAAPPDRPLWQPMLHFLADGRLAAINTNGLEHLTLLHYDVASGAIESSAELPHTLQIGFGPISVSGDRAIVEEVREHDYRRTLFDLRDGRRLRGLPDWHARAGIELRNRTVTQGAVSRDLSRAWVFNDVAGVEAWSLTGRQLAASAPGITSSGTVALAPGEARVAVPGDQGGVVVLDAATLHAVHRLDGPKRPVAAIAISPDGALVVAGGLDGLFAWRLADGARVVTVDFSAGSEAPTALAFSPDGATLWVGTSIGNLHRFAVRAP
jgi:WD40 repeat protein